MHTQQERLLSKYIEKRILFPSFISEKPSSDLGLIIVIPSYNEQELHRSIQSLSQCEQPSCHVEIIVVINASESSPQEIIDTNMRSYEMALSVVLPSWCTLHCIIKNDLPKKKAGVGLARKIGMDEALRRYYHLENPDGIIVCFDADSSVSANYLKEIDHFFSSTSHRSCSIDYHHPTSGDEYDPTIYEGIIHYELHLRYFIEMQKRIGLPFAYHTVGSSMACTMSAYASIGGMNIRKAGEDFYFIQKLIKYGHHGELNSTKVIPSPRLSDRVPFGTGRAILEMKEKNAFDYFTYHPTSFYILEELVNSMTYCFERGKFAAHLDPRLIEYLSTVDGNEVLARIRKNTSDYKTFQKGFWQWFDAFQLMKYLHYIRDNYIEDLSIVEAMKTAFNDAGPTALEQLQYLRSLHDQD